MIRVQNPVEIANAIVGRSALNQDQKVALADYITTLSGTEEEKFVSLHTERVVPNPNPQGRVPRGEWLPDELKNHLLQLRDQNGLSVWAKLELMRESQDLPTKAFATEVLATFSLKSINMQNPYVQAGLQQLVNSGVLTSDMATELTTIPDPGWQPLIRLPSIVEEVCGMGAVLEWGEFQELLTFNQEE